MARKKSSNKTIHFLVTFILMATGIYYFGLSYVPKKWYETQTMMPNQVESYYVNQWCTSDFGRREAVLWNPNGRAPASAVKLRFPQTGKQRKLSRCR